MALSIHYDIMSQPSRSVLLFCEVNNISYEKEITTISSGDNQADEFKAINPMGRVPAMKDGDFTLTESEAILKYLVNKYKTPDHWYPSDPLKKAKVDEYLAWHHANTRTHCIRVFWTEVLIPKMKGRDVDQKKLAEALQLLDGTLSLLENMFLKDQPFLCGDDITLADLMAVPEFMQLTAAARNPFPNQPKLTAWLERVKSRLQPKFDEFHTPIYKMKQKRLKDTKANL
ncbi:glutathione S-transferase theta-1-like [Ptychodera flava]|uniref:glutathione S-transferase theta-1-like n=1 Tax=Ptychodera flava TaxID=63121 RepID=UPI00396A069C